MASDPHGLRVLHVIPSIAARYGGPSQAIVDMCRALAARNVEPLVATTDADGPGRLPVEHGRVVDYDGVPTIFFPRQWSEAFKVSHPLATWLGQHVRRFDVVHVHAVFSHACLAAARACRRQGIPYLVRPLGTLDPWSLRQKPLRKRLLWHLGVRQMLGGAAAIHYTAAEEQRLAESALGLDRGVVIPLGINLEALARPADPQRFRQQWPALGQQPYVLVLCRLHPKKGLEPFLEAFLAETARPELNDWRLVIAGDGEPDYVAGLRDLVARRGGRQRVLFTGWLGGVDKLAALRGAALMGLPSRQENFGLAVVEAMASGVPVLVSRHVNLAPEIDAAGAGWVVPLKPAGLRAGLVEALNDPDERARRGAAGHRLAHARFSWPPIADQLAGLYASIRRSG